MRVLAIGAHPDDVEFYCGGTLARYAAEGHHVVMAHLCNGNKGGLNIEPDELARVRDQEARNAAAIIGAQAVGGLWGDLESYPSEEKMREVVDLIREAAPDLIFTHYPEDYMLDHNATSRLVFEAAFAASVPLFPSRVAKPIEIVPMYYMPTVAGIRFSPTEYVDITDFLEQKKQMILAHQSQIGWLEHHHGFGELEQRVEATARFWGMQCECRFAEPFMAVPASGRLRARRLLP